MSPARSGPNFTAPAVVFNVEYIADTGKQARNSARNILGDRHFELRENAVFAIVGLIDAAFSIPIVHDEAGDSISRFSGVCDQKEFDGPRNSEMVALCVIRNEQFGVCPGSIEKEFNYGHLRVAYRPGRLSDRTIVFRDTDANEAKVE